MKKAKQILSTNKFIILLTLISVIFAIIEMVSAQNEILYGKNYGVSFMYGVRDITAVMFYFLLLIYFSVTLKKRRRLEFILALILLLITSISFLYIKSFSFRFATPYDYYKLVYADPVIFEFAYYKSPVYGETAVYQHTLNAFSFNFIAAMLSLVICVSSIINSIIKANKQNIREVDYEKSE